MVSECMLTKKEGIPYCTAVREMMAKASCQRKILSLFACTFPDGNWGLGGGVIGVGVSPKLDAIKLVK